MRETPVTSHCTGRHLQDFGGLVDAQAAKETQFHDFTLPRVELGERPQRFVERDHFGTLVG